MESKIIHVPWVIKEHTEDSLKEYNLFMEQYNKLHKYCPKCGEEKHLTTLMGYILNWDERKKKKQDKEKIRKEAIQTAAMLSRLLCELL